MKYDRQKAWDVTQRTQNDLTFQSGYKDGYTERLADEAYLKKNPKHPFVIGFLKGRAALKKDKMKELVSGTPMPARFRAFGRYIEWDDFQHLRATNRWSAGHRGANKRPNLVINGDLETAAKAIANAIDEDIIENG